MTTETFEITTYLTSKKKMAAYLSAVLEHGDDQDLIVALGDLARAVGMTQLSEETGMSRTSLYKALSEGSSPQFSTILKIVRALGADFKIVIFE